MSADPSSWTGSTLFDLVRTPNEPQAWAAFVKRYGPKIHSWCRTWGLQQADAENVTQDVLTLLFQRIATFRYDRQKGSFRAWLKTITRHAWSDYLEKQQRAGLGSGDSASLERLQTVAARDDLARELEQAFDLELLEVAMKRVQLQVSSRDRQIFTDLTLKGRSAADVAAEQQMKVTAVLMAKSRVQKKLRAELRRLEGNAPEDTP